MSDEMQPDQRPATQADLERFATKTDLERFATKTDLERFATKTDLERFATKTDLERFAMKTDLERFATKADLRTTLKDLTEEIRGFTRQFALEIMNLKTDVSDIRGYMKDKLVTRDEFHARMDGFGRRVEDHDWSAAKNRARLDDHEKRINALEEKRPQ
jgi:uncharacterized hydantoinase/oxoprolinase family protein